MSELQTAGRSGRPKMRQRCCASSWTQRTPAGLPCSMPGIGEVIDGAVQHAPQSGRQSMDGDAICVIGSRYRRTEAKWR
ncbi:MAG: hypothetical protein Q8N33_10870 [Rhodocyclaceae bacterium]|nr:hypothetical protein [Rhodocyclaceae bacterium]